MSDTYYLVVTDVGLSLIETAYNNGTQVNITQMGLGDSNGAYVAPDVTFTELVNEFGREDIHESISGEGLIDVIVYVGAAHAGKTVREFGLYDDAGNLIVYGAYPDSLVPDETTSEYIQLEIEARVYVTNASSVNVTVNPYIPYATETTAGVVIISNKYDGDSETVVVTEKALKDGLATRYGPDNPPPLVLNRLYPDDLSVSILSLVGTNDRVEWILPERAAGAKFALLRTKVTVTEPTNILLRVYAHNTESGGATTPNSHAYVEYVASDMVTLFGVYQTFMIPITSDDGVTAKRLSFGVSTYGPTGQGNDAVTQLDVEIDDLWN
ncbi:TPA: phage tail protein [Vibrio parahaemolyticus]